MLSSKDILEHTGISRATLNNYIAAGLVARPEVLPPGPNDGGAPRLGYFPEDTVERIETIQRLKREGWSLGRMVAHFRRGEAGAASAANADPMDEVRPEEPASPVAPHALSPRMAAPQWPASGAEPEIMVVAALGVALHDADELWVRLSVHDYFELTTAIETEVRRIVAAGQGHAARLAPCRFLCHFLPRAHGSALAAALEAARTMREASHAIGSEWASRQGRDAGLRLNAGLSVGEAWVSAGAGGEPHVMGDATAEAVHMARSAPAGALLLARDFLARLPAAVRQRIVHGVQGLQGARRVTALHAEGAQDAPAAPDRLMGFTRLADYGQAHGMPRRIADTAVTELIEWRDTNVVGKDMP